MLYEFFGSGRICLVSVPEDLVRQIPAGRAGMPLALWAVQTARDARVWTAPSGVLTKALRAAGRLPGASCDETRARALAWAAEHPEVLRYEEPGDDFWHGACM